MNFDLEHSPEFNRLAIVLPSEGWRATDVYNYAVENGATQWSREDSDRRILARFEGSTETKLYTFDEIRKREPKKNGHRAEATA